MVQRIKKIIFVIGIFWLPLTHGAPTPLNGKAGHHRLFTELSYFNTTANYDSSGGSFTSLGNGRYYRLIDTHWGGEYWFGKITSLIAQVNYARAESNDGFFTRTRSQLTEASLGLRYRWLALPVQVIPEFFLTLPFNRVDINGDEVLTGEGTLRAWFAAWFIHDTGAMSFYAQPGLLYQDEGRASLFEYILGSKWQPEGWWLAGEFFGAFIAKKDSKSSTPSERETVTGRVDGGSLKFYAVNPQWMGLRAKVGVPLTPDWEFGFSFAHTFNGENSAHGWTAMANLELSLGATAAAVNEEREEDAPRVLRQPIEEKEFVPEAPAYDSSVFEEPKPKARRRTRPATPKVDVDKALEDVQQSLEKKNRRRKSGN